MGYILESFNDTWNYTFLLVALVAVAIGTFLTMRKMKRDDKENHKNDNQNKN